MTAPYSPTWSIPSAPGQLSNKRGSNTGADAITLKTHYLNPNGSTDLAGSMLVSAVRTGVSGIQQTPQAAWSPGWVGTPAASALPAALSNTNGSNPSIIYSGRIYFVATDGTIVSSLLSGGNVGTWRYEFSPNSVTSLSTFSQPAVVNGRMYVLCNQGLSPTGFTVAYATITPDGTLGSWATGPTFSQIVDGGAQMAAYGSATAAWVLIIGGSTGATKAYYAPISLADGSVGTPVATTAPATERDYAMTYYDSANSVLYLIGGQSPAGTVVGTTIFAPITQATGAVGTWSSGASLPAVRNGAGLAAFPSIGNQGLIFVIGGSTGTDWTVGANQVTTLYGIPLGNGSGSVGTLSAAAATWTTFSVLPTATAACGGFATPNGQTWGGSTYTQLIGNVGGRQGAGSVATVYTAGVKAPSTVSSWRSGASTGLVVSDLGTGAVVAANQDGSQDWTFNYNAFGTATVAGFVDGDQVQFAVQFADAQGGDPSAQSMATMVKIGQPPTITNIVIGAGGQPTLSFSFNAGAGGGPQNSWRVQVGSLFDTATLYTLANSVVLLQAPMFANGVQQTATVTVASTDVPISGSTASATTTANFTPAYTASAVPTTLSAVPNNANGSVTVQWTNPLASTATQNRVYFRLNGASVWQILQDSITAVINSPQSVVLFDQIRINVAYDFAVSAIGPGPGESALATAGTNVKIDPTGQGYTAILHIAGKGATYNAPIAVQAPPAISTRVDSRITEVFGQAAPTARYGIFDYRSIRLSRVLIKDVPTLKNVQNIILQAILGQTIYYRDALGNMFTCALGQTQAVTYEPAIYRYLDLNLTEVSNQYSPSTTTGSATGFLQQVNGTITPLDVSEVAL